MTFACMSCVKGQRWIAEVLDVWSSIPTTTMSSRGSRSPRIENRVSTVFSSSERKAFVA